MEIKKITLLINNKLHFFIEDEVLKNYNSNNNNIISSFLDFLFLENKLNIIHIFSFNLNIEGFLIINFLSNQFNYNFKPLIFNLDIFNIKIFYKKKKIIFWCGYKLIPENFDKLIKSFEIKDNNKLIKKINQEINTNCNISSDIIKEIFFFKQILENVFKFFNEFKISIKKDNIFSASGFAYKCFFKCFNKNNIKKFLKSDIDFYIRNSYFGGRCEVFGNPEENDYIYYIDYVGMYGQCMLENFPVDDGNFSFKEKKINKPGFYEITYKSNNMFIPILPHKNTVNKKLMFCNGENRGMFWYEEILLFLENGGEIIKIHSAYLFDEMSDVFSNYINYFTDFKNKGESFKKLGKLYINSLYGRLGMQPSSLKTIFISDEKEFQRISLLKGVNKISQLNNYWIIEYDNTYLKLESENKNWNYNFNSNVIYASIIASKARIKLNQTLLMLNKQCKILYCDTDSVFYSSPAPLNINIENTTVNIKKIKDAVFISPKFYSIKYNDNLFETVIRGLKENINFETIKKNFYDSKKFNKINNNVLLKNHYNLKLEKRFYNLDLHSYNKRKWSLSKKTSTAYYYINNFYI